MKFLRCLAVVCFLPFTAFAVNGARAKIEANYAQRADAARWKFVDGMLAHRRPDYAAFDPSGARLPTQNERRAYREELNGTFSVRETVKVVDFRQIASDQARCRVQESVVVTRYDSESQTFHAIDYKAELLDDWRLDKRGWLLQTTHILARSSEKVQPGHVEKVQTRFLPLPGIKAKGLFDPANPTVGPRQTDLTPSAKGPVLPKVKGVFDLPATRFIGPRREDLIPPVPHKTSKVKGVFDPPAARKTHKTLGTP